MSCQDGDTVVVASHWIECPFDVVAERVDPANWAASVPIIFSGTRREAPAPATPSGPWVGPLREQVNLAFLQISNRLWIDYAPATAAGPARRLDVSFTLQESLDGRMSVNAGQIIVIERVDSVGATVKVVFTKRCAFNSPTVFSDYCYRLQAFLTMAVDILAVTCGDAATAPA